MALDWSVAPLVFSTPFCIANFHYTKTCGRRWCRVSVRLVLCMATVVVCDALTCTSIPLMVSYGCVLMVSPPHFISWCSCHSATSPTRIQAHSDAARKPKWQLSGTRGGIWVIPKFPPFLRLIRATLIIHNRPSEVLVGWVLVVSRLSRWEVWFWTLSTKVTMTTSYVPMIVP